MTVFSEVELRVMGVLIEKSLTQPGAYPMTVNSIVLGANQLQNRDPVVSHSESDVSAALRNLTHKGFVTQAATSTGARAVRFEHCVVEKLHWDRREQAVMAELILRGRQTAGELRTHASRMTALPDLPAVTTILESLRAHSPPFVEELPREPGRSANRFRHLLSGEAQSPPSAAEPLSLEARVAILEREIAEVKKVLASKLAATTRGVDEGTGLTV